MCMNAISKTPVEDRATYALQDYVLRLEAPIPIENGLHDLCLEGVCIRALPDYIFMRVSISPR
jgi:hypothetical protein